MGRLYDKRDLEFNLAYIDRVETAYSTEVAEGRLDGSALLKFNLSKYVTDAKTTKYGRVNYRTIFDKFRSKERMQLLRTYQLVRDMKAARAAFLACSRCFTQLKDGKTIDRPCDVHKPVLAAAKAAIFWAGKRNVAVREYRGQVRTDDSAEETLESVTGEHTGEPLNEWERWYYADRRDGVWNDADREHNIREYGSHDYRGWLRMLLEEEEIPLATYQSEVTRLSEAIA